MIAWSVILSLAATALGTVVIWVGLPLMAATLIISHWWARFRKGLALWQGASDWEDLPPAPRKPGALSWIWATLRSPERWRELAYGLVGTLFDWILALIAISIPAAGINQVITPLIPQMHGLADVILGAIAPRAIINAVNVAMGVICLIASVPLVWLCAKAQEGIAKSFLAPTRQAITTRLSHLEKAKALGEQAETVQLTRIERDLHDGPQQSLIRTGLDLASLERRLDAGDTDGARAILGEVRARNDDTLAEIRTLSRGFAPPVLAEKGLAEAIASLAAISPIPCSVSTDLAGPRPPEAAERAIYYAISEALVNAAKHSGATQVTIEVHQNAAGISAVVRDNGVGGAVVLPGHGLAGLGDRLTSVGGRLSVDPNPGGGTAVRVEVTLR